MPTFDDLTDWESGADPANGGDRSEYMIAVRCTKCNEVYKYIPGKPGAREHGDVADGKCDRCSPKGAKDR